MISPGRIEKSWFWGRIEVGDCWLWQGPKATGGYGQVKYLEQHWPVHRLVWTMLVGDIPKRHQIDHLCMVRLCCNPDHLEVVSKAENQARRRKSRGRDAKRICHRGHRGEWSKTNSGKTICLGCNRERVREHRARKAAE